MITEPDRPTDTVARNRWSAPTERTITQAMYILAILAVCAMIFILAEDHTLDHASVTALFGGALGSLGTTLSHKLSSRGTDGNGNRNGTSQ